MAGRWERARVITRKTKARKAISPFSLFWRKPTRTLGENCAMSIAPMGTKPRPLHSVIAALPQGIEKIFARADSGFYCWQAVEAYQKAKVRFILVARKTSRLLEQRQTAKWKPSPKTDADQQCEFRYQPEGWGQPYRFSALRYRKKEEENKNPKKREQYQLFDTPEYTYRVFVTDMNRAINLLVWFYNQRAGAENLIT